MSATPVGVRHPLARALLLLTFSTGLVDAVSYLGLGRVFTANMTGNIVFLGFAATGAPGFRIAPYLVAIATFLMGAAIAGRIGKAHTGRPLRRWLMVAAMIEAGLLCSAAVAATGFDIATQLPELRLFAIIALTAIAMGFRNATIRQLKIPDLTTTVLTLTLTGLAADSAIAGGANPNWARRLASVAAIFAGAAIGAVLVTQSGLVIPLVLAGLVVLVGTIACALHPGSAHPAS